MYLICFSLSIFFAALFNFVNEDKFFKKSLLVLTILPLFLLGALRYGIGTDYNLYSNEYYNLSIGRKPHYDLGFSLINEFALKCSLGYQFVIAFSFALFIYGFFYFYIKSNKSDILFGTLLLIFSYNYFISFSLIAQYSAIGMLFIGVSKLFDENFFGSTICIIIAACLHSSSLVFIFFILFFYVYKKSKYKTHLFIFGNVLCVLFYFFGTSLIVHIAQNTRFAGYLTDQSYASVISGSFVVINVVLLIYELFIIWCHKELLQSSMHILLYFIQAVACVLSLMQGDIILLFRLIYFFSAFGMVSIAVYTKEISNRKLKFICEFLIVISYLVWWFAFPMKNDYYNVVPYVSVFGEVNN